MSSAISTILIVVASILAVALVVVIVMGQLNSSATEVEDVKLTERALGVLTSESACEAANGKWDSSTTPKCKPSS